MLRICVMGEEEHSLRGNCLSLHGNIEKWKFSVVSECYLQRLLCVFQVVFSAAQLSWLSVEQAWAVTEEQWAEMDPEQRRAVGLARYEGDVLVELRGESVERPSKSLQAHTHCCYSKTCLRTPNNLDFHFVFMKCWWITVSVPLQGGTRPRQLWTQTASLCARCYCVSCYCNLFKMLEAIYLSLDLPWYHHICTSINILKCSASPVVVLTLVCRMWLIFFVRAAVMAWVISFYWDLTDERAFKA